MRFKNGWIKLHRDLFEKYDTDFRASAIFIWLIAKANIKDGRNELLRQRVKLKRGQLVTSERELFERTGWARKTVHRVLKKLQKEGSISLLRSPLGTIVTIENYEQYQSSDNGGYTTGYTTEYTTGYTTGYTHSEERKKVRKKEIVEVNAVASTPVSVIKFFTLWNSLKSDNQPEVKINLIKNSSTRVKHAQNRLKEISDLTYWEGVIKKIAASPFCNGQNDRMWIATIDFLIRPDTHVKVMEGKYDEKILKPIKYDMSGIFNA